MPLAYPTRHHPARRHIRGVFDPYAVATIALDLDSSLGVTTGTGGVSTWADQSGNSRDAIQNTEGNRPGVVASVLNGYPAIRFNGSTDRMSISNAAALTNNIGALTVFMVWSCADLAAVQSALFISTTGNTTVRFRISKFTANEHALSARRTDGDTQENVLGAGMGTSPVITTAIADWANDDGFLYKNGALDSSDTGFLTAGNTSSTNSTGVVLGARGDGLANYLQGDIFRVLAVVGKPTQAQREYIERGLGATYGIATP